MNVDKAAVASALLLTLGDTALEFRVEPTATGAQIWIDGADVLSRVLTLGLLAATIGDEEGPEKIPGGRYALGQFGGVSILVRTDVTPAEQAELEAFATRMADGFGTV
jgi:hypothetical protein